MSEHVGDLVRNRERARHRQEILAEFGAAALRLIPFQELIERAVDATRRGVNAERVKILEHKPEGHLLIVAGIGWNECVVGHAALSDDMRSPPGRAFRTGKPVVIDDIREQTEFEWSDLLKAHGVVSLVNVPIKSAEFTFGVLEVDATVPTRWSEEDINFLHGFANLVTAAIQRNRMEAQRAVLLREVHHRVKNNLQLIVSMVNISARRTKDENAVHILRDLARRVAAVGSVYDLLMANSSARRLGLKSYLDRLCEKLKVAAREDERVRIKVDVPDVKINIDDAIPLGLIVNELITNSLKHAFPERGGTVSVAVRLDADRCGGALVVADDGVGKAPGSRPGLGMETVSILARQLRGEVIEHTRQAGTAIEVRFLLSATAGRRDDSRPAPSFHQDRADRREG